MDAHQTGPHDTGPHERGPHERGPHERGPHERGPHERGPHPTTDPDAPVVIDCDDCAMRGPGCPDCVVSVLLGVPDSLLADERAALDVLAEAGLAPRLRLVPVHRPGGRGLAS